MEGDLRIKTELKSILICKGWEILTDNLPEGCLMTA